MSVPANTFTPNQISLRPKVRAAINSLISRGEYPTVRKVCEEVGASGRDVQPLMREWRDEQAGHTSAATPPSRGVPCGDVSVVVLAAAEAMRASFEQSLHGLVSTVRAERAEDEQKHAQLLASTLRDAEDRAAPLTVQIRKLEAELEAEESGRITAEEKIFDLIAQLERLSSERDAQELRHSDLLDQLEREKGLSAAHQTSLLLVREDLEAALVTAAKYERVTKQLDDALQRIAHLEEMLRMSTAWQTNLPDLISAVLSHQNATT
ncbi:DNA-binding protein [Azospirillum brasilense]|uniref:DNA-binding protein n=1 Tax=Azospirillum brasilense TaxID=192 RepID=UPI000E68C18C|nr:DNA-binding protein [Azospirillum brasilense]NUB28772.1 hypothetical protein [Azospirillum brasilense]NUB33992.1 hypothetical protein [Azospirillum brasilense]RIW01497.1 hypothetical protein D2T81_18020 [Azospirillum brasilense]